MTNLRRLRNKVKSLYKSLRDRHEDMGWAPPDSSIQKWIRSALDAAIESNECPYCTRRLTLAQMSLDHVVPIARGGDSSTKNLAICHKVCNTRKGVMNATEFLVVRREVLGKLTSGWKFTG
jgi:5-methylcytosine-specific restriction endonuclease McrA